jgi:hypothetical protein
MLLLQSHHIIDVFCLIDDLLPISTQSRRGRPSLLSDSELVTILIWNTLTVRSKTLKDVHVWLRLYHSGDFPRIPRYAGFVRHCHRVLPQLFQTLEQLLVHTAPLRFVDSTMLPVCKYVRADRHKVAKNIARFGKNHQGWHYGFKLHASVDTNGRLCGVALTPANCHDAQMLHKVLNEHTNIAVGDGGYTARVMKRRMWERYGTLILSPPHYTQRTQLMTPWQHLLLKARTKVECAFDYLKEHLHLVSSFPRSVTGYILHYVRVLLGYQCLVL